MRTQLIAGNWKMHGSIASIPLLLEEILKKSSSINSTQLELAVFPPFVYLDLVSRILQGSKIQWGAQNLSSEAAGAFTGEISAAMLQDFHCQYVIVGHSERRTLNGETDQHVAAKFVAALSAELRPILCVGETARERQAGTTLQVIERQLAVALKLADNSPNLVQAVVAYEPVWAIGTGQNATPEQAQEVHAAIRAQLNQHSAGLGDRVRIIYGGSVKPDNAGTLFNQLDIDGALIGGASLQANQFVEIAQQCKH